MKCTWEVFRSGRDHSRQVFQWFLAKSMDSTVKIGNLQLWVYLVKQNKNSIPYNGKRLLRILTKRCIQTKAWLARWSSWISLITAQWWETSNIIMLTTKTNCGCIKRNLSRSKKMRETSQTKEITPKVTRISWRWQRLFFSLMTQK